MPARAAAPPQIERVRIGLPAGPDTGRSRDGVWAPVRVTLKAGNDDVPRGAYRLVVETADGEAVPYRYPAAVPALAANSEQAVFAYARPGSPGGTFSVTLQTADGHDVQTIARLSRDPSEAKGEILEPRDVLYLTVGARLPALRRAVLEPDKPPPAPGAAEDEPEDRGKQRFAFVENVADLPDRWFGYEAADVVLLTTSGDAFVNQLLEMDRARREALLEWVRRGGRLVLSVGRNQQAVARWLDKVPLADVTLSGKGTRSSLTNFKFWIGPEVQQKQPPRQVEVARVRPGPNAAAVVWEGPEAGDLERRPVIVQSACGLGRVVLVAFDLDAPPFSTWDGQAAFWKKLQAEVAPHPPADAKNFGGLRVELAELGGNLKRGLETFEEVPVISFGWVALFILFYIALVGPLDYFILKKVFKRLELTWITFPAVVLVVSVAAYATAYHFKGDDLRVNKIDVVEIDLHGSGQVYGTSWFTLFSPRVQNYTVGLEPAAPEWGGRGEDDAVMVATWDGPEASLGGNAQSLFRHPYEYAEDATGVRRVPIPVWGTRTFTASWRAPLTDGDRPPPVAAALRVSRDGKALSGAVTNNTPAELHGAVLFFQGQWYELGNLVPGEARDVAPLFERGVKPRSLQEWFSDPVWLPHSGLMPTRQQRGWPGLASYQVLRSLMFHDQGGSEPPASGLHGLDQGWRLPPQSDGPPRVYRDEAVLVARTPPRNGRAEEVTREGVAPTRLQLDDPSGYLQQETYVRIYIPLARTP